MKLKLSLKEKQNIKKQLKSVLTEEQMKKFNVNFFIRENLEPLMEKEMKLCIKHIINTQYK